MISSQTIWVYWLIDLFRYKPIWVEVIIRYIFINTKIIHLLWEKHVSIAVSPYWAGPIRSFAVISAGIITTIAWTAKAVPQSGMSTAFLKRTGVFYQNWFLPTKSQCTRRNSLTLALISIISRIFILPRKAALIVSSMNMAIFPWIMISICWCWGIRNSAGLRAQGMEHGLKSWISSP